MIESSEMGAAEVQHRALAGLVDLFAELEMPAEDGSCIDLLEGLERIKSAAAAAQARVADGLDRRRSSPGSGSSRRSRRDASLGAEIGLARRESPHQGRGHLSLARALLHDLPHTYRALCRGDLSERRAQIIATETGVLSRELRLLVDAEVAGDPDSLEGLGEGRLQQTVRRVVLRVDEEAVLARHRRAHASRRLTGRLLPDGMAQVSVTMADWQYAAVVASFAEAADRARAAGDDRTRGQFQADTAVERLTGQATASCVPVAVKIVISAESLFGDDCTPAYVQGCGHVPAGVARRLVSASPEVLSTVQRLFHFPGTGALVAMERDGARFPEQLRDFIAIRDQICRTPWCNAPVRHTDHVVSRARGGETSADNGQGLCEACNYVKESPGWRHRPDNTPMAPHSVDITTPTGHRHRSTAPPAPVPSRAAPRIDLRFSNLVLIA